MERSDLAPFLAQFPQPTRLHADETEKHQSQICGQACRQTEQGGTQAMGAKAGLDPQKMLDLLNSGTARSAATSDILTDAVLNRRFAFGARVSIIDKDVRIGLDEAKNLGVPTPVISTAAALWNDAVSRHGIGDEDFTAILLPIERAAGGYSGAT